MNTHYTLHYAPDNASLIVRLVLEELGQSYDTTLVDRGRSQQNTPAYRALNPNGLIPVLETPRSVMFETGAILLWLADAHRAMAPAPDDPARGDFLKWLFFVSNTLHADLRLVFYPALYTGDDPGAQTRLRAQVTTRLRRHLSNLDEVARSAPPWFNADDPSVLCYYVACLMRWMALYPSDGDRGWYAITATPHLHAMLGDLECRAATRAAQTAEGLGPTPFTVPTHATPPEGSAT